MLWQPALPPEYDRISDSEIAQRITERRSALGKRLIILGHHYQQDDVIQHADFTGDSFKLSQLAAEKVQENGAEFVVFCGVHFMAESADILTPPEVKVILPDLSAGCSMADMANYEQTCRAWDTLQDSLQFEFESEDDQVGSSPDWHLIPITYMNSSAAIKAFVGQHGGAVCTSSNADSVFKWALAGGGRKLRKGQRVKILFLPDQHLGRNTAHNFGFVTEVDAKHSRKSAQTAVWDPMADEGGLTIKQMEEADVLLWKGHCSVHMLFRPEHVEQSRSEDPDVNVIVHPECMQEVVDLADYSGSTEKILNTIRKSKPGTSWAVGTEVHLVNRVANELADRDISVKTLSGCQCLCTTMYRISPQRLLWVLDGLAEGQARNVISVHDDARKWALVSLNRMLELTAGGPADTPTKQSLAGV